MINNDEGGVKRLALILKDPENGNINMKITKDYKKLVEENLL